MSDYIQRTEFDATIDDMVDTSLRLTRGTRAGRLFRRRDLMVVSGSVALAFLLTCFMRAKVITSRYALIVTVLGLGLGCGFGLMWRSVCDWSMKRRLRRLHSELLGGRDAFRSEIELRPEGVWTRQTNVEYLFSWSEAVDVKDAHDAIELRFKAGLVVARNRGFVTPSDRQSFLDRARALARRPSPHV